MNTTIRCVQLVKSHALQDPDIRRLKGGHQLPRWLRPCKRLIRWAWYRASEAHPQETSRAESVEITCHSVRKAIERSKFAVQQIYHEHLRRVVVGFDQLHELQNDLRYNSFQVSIGVEMNGMDGMLAANLEVLVCPWFNGILVLPDFPQDRRQKRGFSYSDRDQEVTPYSVSYTHLRAHET